MIKVLSVAMYIGGDQEVFSIGSSKVVDIIVDPRMEESVKICFENKDQLSFHNVPYSVRRNEFKDEEK